MIEACRLQNRARRLQQMPLKATSTMVALRTILPMVGDSWLRSLMRYQTLVPFRLSSRNGPAERARATVVTICSLGNTDYVRESGADEVIDYRNRTCSTSTMPEEKISAGRLAAFSDAVFAVIVTIMVLELKAPDQPTFRDLWPRP